MTASRWRTPRSSAAQDRERDDAREQPGGQERQAEEQVEAERGADELREVARHRDGLGLQPEEDAHRAARSCSAADLGEVVAGGDAELRAHRLDQHRHQVRDEDDPQQQVAVLRARGDVGGEVARVDVGDRGDEGRPEERPQAAQAAAGARPASAGPPRGRAARRAARRRAGRDRTGGFRDCPPMRMRAASSREMACRSPATSTVSGPSKGAWPTMTHALVGHEAELGEVAQQPGVAVRHAPDHGLGAARRARSAGGRPRRRARARPSGSGRRAGRASDGRAQRRCAPRASPRGGARGARPRRAPRPTTARAPASGRARAAGGGGSPRARPACPPRSARRRGRARGARGPTPARRLIIAVAEAAVTPSRSASALVLTLPVRSSIQIAFR